MSSHWSGRYIGQPYVADEMDCAAWVERILREELGRTVSLPTDRAAGHRGKSRQIQDSLADFGEPTSTPKEGDAVVMISRGQLRHLGLYLNIEGQGWVLHAMENAGQVVRHRLRDLQHNGLKIEGFYKWK